MKYGKIKPVDVANGEGVRVSLFVSGCEHHCKGCFNPELWSHDSGEEFTDNVLFELLDLCSEPYISGLTILGGEPLTARNISTVSRICYVFKRKFPNKSIWCYTGYDWEDVKQTYPMTYIDVLVDGKFVQELHDPRLKFRGSSNQRIIDVKKSRDTGKIFLVRDLMYD